MPDEARILAALSDGSTPGGEFAERQMTAVPRYVGRVRALGLVETGPEDETAEE